MTNPDNHDLYRLFLAKMSSNLKSEVELRIAQTILENAPRLMDLDLKQLAKMASTSTASVSRFVNEFPIGSYREFVHHFLLSASHLDYAKKIHNFILDQYQPDEISQLELARLKSNLEATKATMTPQEFTELAGQLKNSSQVIIIGANHSLAIMAGLHQELLLNNVAAYLFTQQDKLEHLITQMERGDLALFVAVEGRYQQAVGTQLLTQLKEKGVSCLLLSQSRRLDTCLFDRVFYYGNDRDGNTGYYSLNLVADILIKALNAV